MRYLLVAVLFLSVLACGSTSVLTDTASSNGGGGDDSNPNQAPTYTATPIEVVEDGFDFFVKSPADGEVVSQPEVEIRVWANVEAVLTINEEIYVVPAQKDYIITFPLEEGPNLLELVASDYAGNEIDLVLTVTYQP